MRNETDPNSLLAESGAAPAGSLPVPVPGQGQAAPVAAPTPSLRDRYGSKVFTGMVRLGISLVTQAIIPRSLGPSAYGNFSFLSNFFTQVFNFLDGGTSTAFYTHLSQRPSDRGLVRFYWGYVGLTAVAAVALVLLVFVTGFGETLWPGQETLFIGLAVLLGWIVFCNRVAGSIVDAHGLTVRGELQRLWLAFVGLGLILLLFGLGRLHLAEYFVYSCLIPGLLVLAWWRVLARHGIALFPRGRLAKGAVRAYGREFTSYAAPLFASSVLVLVVGLADRWLLQEVAGSVEQGFFGLSAQIGTVCLLFTAALTPLLIREFARAFARGDHEALRALFGRYGPLFFTLSAYFGLFIAVEARHVVALFGGQQFQGATTAVCIMALYPIHQTYGQLSGALFLGTGQTRLYSRLSVLLSLLPLPLTVWLVGPARWGCLDLKATGLALKMEVVVIVGVELQLWLNSRQLRLSFVRLLWHQIATMASLLGLALAASTVAGWLFQAPLPAFLAAGVLYTLGVAGIAVAIPALFSMTRPELLDQIRWVWGTLRRPGAS